MYDILDSNSSIKYRSKILLLAGEGYTVPEIRRMTNIYDKTVRKWIHKFNDCGIAGLFTKVDYSNTVKINDKDKKEILYISSISPRVLGLKFSTWSLRSIAGYVKEKKIAKDGGISHTTVRDILREYGIEWRHSKTVLSSSSSGGGGGGGSDPEYDLKKSVLKS